MSALESKLRRLAASLENTALEALASKGLVRRAQKDLERGMQIAVAGEGQSTLRVRVGEFEVLLPESGPATATCSCPAAGVCQHILGAVLFLQKVPAQTEPEHLQEVTVPDPVDTATKELMSITAEQLETWSGKASFKAGLRLASQCIPEILRERSIRIQFPAINAEVHFVPGGGLDGTIVSGARGNGRELVVAAVIAFQQTQGKEWGIPKDAPGLVASEGAPRSRPEVMDSCQTLLEETLSNGLSRISVANQQRWATLAVSALGVNLPRLALLLRGIGDEAALVVARDAKSDLARTLGRMAQAHALCAALQKGGDNPRVDLVGFHRTRYDEVGHLDLIGAAAWPWRTASGYEGLTLLFWDPSAKHWDSWTESRPKHQLADFKPVTRYTQPGPWEGAESPRQLARCSFRLMNARRNPTHRLSGSSKSRVLVAGPAELAKSTVAVIDDWAQLLKHSTAYTPLGLKETHPLESIFALKPTTWGERGFDPVRQVFAWRLADNKEQVLLLEIGFDDFTEPAIKFLETIEPQQLHEALVIGRLQQTERGLALHPYSIHANNGVVTHLCLDNVKPPAAKPNAVQSEEEDNLLEDEEETVSANAITPALGRLLDEVDDGLLALAEAGLAMPNLLRIERLGQLALRAERLGLDILTSSLGHVVARPHPHSLLRCAYAAQLHRRAVPMSLMT